MELAPWLTEKKQIQSVLSGSGPASPSGGGAVPPSGGGVAPPSGSGAAPPSGGGAAPPSGGGAAPPSGGGVAPPSNSGESPTMRFWTRIGALSILGIGALGFIGWAIMSKTSILDRLKDLEYARGLITFVVAVGTMLVALLLIISNALSEGDPPDQKGFTKARFDRGKEILTILMGVLGTIIGFYYGSSEPQHGSSAKETVQELKVSAPQFIPNKTEPGKNLTLITRVDGGEGPYEYIITFNNPITLGKNVVSSVQDKTTDGWIRQTFGTPSKINKGKSLTYEIKVTDKKGVKSSYDSNDPKGVQINIDYSKVTDIPSK